MLFNRLSSDDSVKAGSIVVAGTRVNFDVIASAALNDQMSNDEIRADYGKSIDDDAIQQAIALQNELNRKLAEYGIDGSGE